MENRIGEARREYADRIGGFTQKDAAEYFGVSLSTYKKWEQGQGKLNGGILRDVSAKYGVTVDYLLGIQPARVSQERQPSREERELVELFRRIADEDKPAFLEMARALAFAGDAKKKDALRIDCGAGIALS